MHFPLLQITAGADLLPRFKFTAVDGTERFVFQVEHANWQIHGNAKRNFVNSNFINSKCIRAINIIIKKYQDKVNNNIKKYQDKVNKTREESYFISTSYLYHGENWGIGIPLFWKSPKGDLFLSQYTNLNCGKLVSFIAEGRPVLSSPKHPNDIPIRMTAITEHSYDAIIYV